MKKTNISINLNIEIKGLSEEIADSITTFLKTSDTEPCLDNKELIKILHLKNRPIMVASVERTVRSNKYDFVEINLKG